MFIVNWPRNGEYPSVSAYLRLQRHPCSPKVLRFRSRNQWSSKKFWKLRLLFQREVCEAKNEEA